MTAQSDVRYTAYERWRRPIPPPPPERMPTRYQLEYWRDDRWFVGRLPQVPGVFSQGATLEELEENIKDAFRLMQDDQADTGFA